MKITFVKTNIEGEVEKKRALFANDEHAQSNMEPDALPEYFKDINKDILEKIDKYSREGSRCILAKIATVTVQIAVA